MIILAVYMSCLNREYFSRSHQLLLKSSQGFLSIECLGFKSIFGKICNDFALLTIPGGFNIILWTHVY